MSTARPTVSVYNTNGTINKDNQHKSKSHSLCLPAVFSAPLRADLVRTVFSNMNKNKRQAYAVKFEAGYGTAASSWGTGRAVARIPRVPGGGTHRSGQAAFGNMCRGGGMFNPTKTWRRWHRKVNVTEKRHAVAAALAATAIPALVMARGHKIDKVPELPLVLSDDVEKIKKTKDAVFCLKQLGCGDDLEKVLESKKVKAGRGKTRNRRYVMRRGPIIVHCMDKEQCMEASLPKSFRNIPGVDICHVDRLNLLQLAPGGSIGRFAIFTKSAIKRLAQLFGSGKPGSADSCKKGYTLPKPMMKNTDISRIINSSEVQSVLLPKKMAIKHIVRRKNPLKNNSALGKLCPFACAEKRRNALYHKKGSKMAELMKKKVLKTKKISKEQNKKEKDGEVKKNKQFMRNLLGAYEVAAKKVEAEEEE